MQVEQGAGAFKLIAVAACSAGAPSVRFLLLVLQLTANQSHHRRFVGEDTEHIGAASGNCLLRLLEHEHRVDGSRHHLAVARVNDVGDSEMVAGRSDRWKPLQLPLSGGSSRP